MSRAKSVPVTALDPMIFDLDVDAHAMRKIARRFVTRADTFQAAEDVAQLLHIAERMDANAAVLRFHRSK